MKIIIAPDSFKGSLTALQAAHSMREGCRAAFPGAEIVCMPLADGGEGTVETMISAAGGYTDSNWVTGPLGEQIVAKIGNLQNGYVVIESAAAHGLTLVPYYKRDPMVTTSYGTGEMLRHTLEVGSRKIVIGLGGTATNDGGLGALQALGANLISHKGDPLPSPATGATLIEIGDIDVSGLTPLLKEAHITVASDVTNPLFGPNGATATYGPQKGATPEMVIRLDAAMQRWADIILRVTGKNVSNVAGAGAAGGLGAALIGFAEVWVRPGIEVILDAMRFERQLEGASLVLTGEGSIDGQTLQGKALSGILKRTNSAGIPAIAFGGIVERDAAAKLKHAGYQDVFEIADPNIPKQERINNADRYLKLSTSKALTQYFSTQG